MKYQVKIFEHCTGQQLSWLFKHYEDAVDQYERLLPTLPKDVTLSIVLSNGLTDLAHSTVERRNYGLF